MTGCRGAACGLGFLLLLTVRCTGEHCVGAPRECALHALSECARAGCDPVLRCFPRNGALCVSQPDTSEADCRAGNCVWSSDGCTGGCGVGIDQAHCEAAGLRWLAADRASCGLLTTAESCETSPDVCQWGACTGTPHDCDFYSAPECAINEGCDHAPDL